MKAEEAAIQTVENRYHNAELRAIKGQRPKGPRLPRKPLVLESARRRAKGVPKPPPMPPPPRPPPRLAESEFPVTAFLRTPPTANGVGAQMAADIGSYRTDMIDLKMPWATAVMNGVPPTADCRYPDPFTLVRTSVFSVVQKVTATPNESSASPTTYSKFVHGAFKGSPIATLGLGAHGMNPANAMEWVTYNASTAPYGLTWYNCGLGDANFFTRPNGMVLSIKPLLRGIEHSLTICAVPVSALRSTEHTASPTGWPTLPALGLSSAQASWGGRTWNFNPGDEEIRLVTLPYDARSLDFQAGNGERLACGSANGVSWSEWVFWIFGLSADDIVEYTTFCIEEAFPSSTTTTVYAYPSQPKVADTPKRDSSTNLISRMAQAGWAALKFTAGTLMDLRAAVRSIGGMDWSSKASSYIGSQAGSFPVEGMPSSAVESKPLVDEEKVDFEVTPRFQRPVANAQCPQLMLPTPTQRNQH